MRYRAVLAGILLLSFLTAPAVHAEDVTQPTETTDQTPAAPPEGDRPKGDRKDTPPPKEKPAEGEAEPECD